MTTLDNWINEALAEDEWDVGETATRRPSVAEEAAEPLAPASLQPIARPSGTYELIELSDVLEGDAVEQVRAGRLRIQS